MQKNILLYAGIAIVVVVASLWFFIGYPLSPQEGRPAKENPSLGELANSIKPIYPNATVVQGMLPSSIDEVLLKQVARNTISGSIVRDQELGVSKGIAKEGLAEITLYMTEGPKDENNIVAITLTNIGSNSFFLKQFAIGGETSRTGMAPLTASVLDSDYSPEVWGSIPKPELTQLIVMNPGDSISAYIKGNYSEQFTGELIDVFSAGASYYYDQDAEEYNNGFAWSISVSSV